MVLGSAFSRIHPILWAVQDRSLIDVIQQLLLCHDLTLLDSTCELMSSFRTCQFCQNISFFLS